MKQWCSFSLDGDSVVCGRCGRRVQTNNPRVKALCRASAAGLGDMVADGLSAMGITKDRVNSIANVFGVADCGCAGRQRWLNKAGESIGLPPGRLDSLSTIDSERSRAHATETTDGESGTGGSAVR